MPTTFGPEVYFAAFHIVYVWYHLAVHDQANQSITNIYFNSSADMKLDHIVLLFSAKLWESYGSVSWIVKKKDNSITIDLKM